MKEKSTLEQEVMSSPSTTRNVSDVLSLSIKKVHAKGFPIYKFLGWYKKQCIKKKQKELRIPDDVLQQVCEIWLVKPEGRDYAWWLTAISEEWRKYNSIQQELRGEQRKKEIPTIGDVLKQLTEAFSENQNNNIR